MTLFCIRGLDDQSLWNLKNCPKFFHTEIFAFWIQMWNPNLCKSHIWWPKFEIQLILKMTLFRICGPDDQNRWNRKNCPKFFRRVIFAFWIQICNSNLCKSHTFWNTANIQKWPCFAYAGLMTKIDEIGKIVRSSFIG